MKLVDLRNPRRMDNGSIMLDARFDDGTVGTFVACQTDVEPLGRAVFADADRGVFGEVVPYGLRNS